jgi:hypothetical protein
LVRCFGQGDDVVIDDVALLQRQRAGADGQVVELVGGEELGLDRIDIAPLAVAADVAHALQVGILHGFAADIGLAQEFPVFIQHADFVVIVLPDCRIRGAVRFLAQFQLPAQRVNLGVALEHLEARVDQMDAIKQGLQLGRLVHDMHRRGDLATIVQEAGNLQLVAIAVVHPEGRQRSFVGFVGGLGQHHGQGRHALAMAAGIGRLFVNRQVDQVDQGLEQFFKLGDQQAIGQRNGGLRSQRFGQALIGR